MNKKFIPRQYQILRADEWKNISYKKAQELLKTGDYRSIELYDEDQNYKSNGLFFSPTEKVEKFDNLEKGLNNLMKKYNG